MKSIDSLVDRIRRHSGWIDDELHRGLHCQQSAQLNDLIDILADHVQYQSASRAQYIRCMAAAARLRCAATHQRAPYRAARQHDQLLQEGEQLLSQYWAEWEPGIFSLMEEVPFALERQSPHSMLHASHMHQPFRPLLLWRRGVVREVRLDTAMLTRKRFAQLARYQPVLRVRLINFFPSPTGTGGLRWRKVGPTPAPDILLDRINPRSLWPAGQILFPEESGMESLAQCNCDMDEAILGWWRSTDFAQQAQQGMSSEMGDVVSFR